MYVLREKNDVSDIERGCKVGSGIRDTYLNWDKYGMRCTVLEGDHYQTDNQMVWLILAKLVRDGAGWTYIKGCEKNGTGDGRKAFFMLKAQCRTEDVVSNEWFSNKNIISGTRWDNSSKNWTLEKYTKRREGARQALVKLGKCPSDEELIKEFARGISSRITPLVDTLRRIQKDPNYKDNYVISVHEVLATWNDYMAKTKEEENGGPGRNKRSASAFNSNQQKNYYYQGNQGGNKKPRFIQNFKPENRSYSKQEWGSLTNQQRQQVIKFRKSKLAEKDNQAYLS